VQGQRNYDAETKAVIVSDGLADAITRTDVLLVEHHGKGGCDAQSNVPKFVIEDATISGRMLDPLTRELVLYLAMHKQAPSISKVNKAGWEAPEAYYYGYFDSIKFTKRAVPDAEGFKGCRGLVVGTISLLAYARMRRLPLRKMDRCMCAKCSTHATPAFSESLMSA